MAKDWSEGDVYRSARLSKAIKKNSPSTGLDTGHDGSEVARGEVDNRMAHFSLGIQDHNKAQRQGR